MSKKTVADYGRKFSLMRALFQLGFCLLAVLLSISPASAKEKIILDTDMVEMFDDGIAMLLLAKAPEVELLGVTVTAGNTWVPDGVAIALRQLELEDISGVPVVPGMRTPFRPGRIEGLAAERVLMGIGPDGWTGAFGYVEPESWRAAYEARYGENPTLEPDKRHAVDFIIEQVKKHPGEVTVASIGPCGNLAMAILKAPEIAPLIRRVVYMGGAFFTSGNVTPAAEFNCWFDPEAARICMRAPFKEQIIVGLDAAEKVPFTYARYLAVQKTLGKSGLGRMLPATYVGRQFAANTNFQHYIWDVLVAAIILDPSLAIKDKTAKVDVNTEYGLSYGQTLAYPEQGPTGAGTARIVLEVDKERFWSFLLTRLQR